MLDWKTQLALVSLLVAAPASAAAFTFSDECAPETEHHPGVQGPNVLLVVDKSGSMATEMTRGWTRWDTATTVISEVTNDLERPGPCNQSGDDGCDPVRFGLGLFSSTATLQVEPGEDTADAINAALDNAEPSGQTQTHTAVQVLVNSARLRDDDRPQVAVLVTDGAPDDANTARAAIRSICTLRGRPNAPVITYVVGFGPGSNQAVNGFMAAAGGTGMCCDGADYPCDAAHQVDPCDMNAGALNAAVLDTGVDDSTYIASRYSCGGSLEATEGNAFKRALLSITDDVACTFKLDIPPNYPAGDSAQVDPDGTRVTMDHTTFGRVVLPYCPPGEASCGLADNMRALGVPDESARPYDDEGWYFLDNARQYVRLSDGLCSQVAQRAVERVTTQVSCMCRFTGRDCTVMIDGFTNEQLANMRCGEGVYECLSGRDVCVAKYGPMPEICNGVDDDCDGTTDNMAESWSKPEFAQPQYDLPAEHAGIACNEVNSCGCPDGSDVVSGTDPASFYDSWSGVCTCGEALEGPEETEYDAPRSTDPQAACSSSDAAAPAGTAGLLLLLLGLVAAARRRG